MNNRDRIISLGIGLVSLCVVGSMMLLFLPKKAIPVQLPVIRPTPVTAQLKDDVPMITIPAGEFIMGSKAEDVYLWASLANSYPFYGYGQPYEYVMDEWPQMSIYLDTFEIDQYEVTYERYQQCVQDKGCSPPLKSAPDNPHYPVEVSHEMAQNYCEWTGKRLPDEAEWEKAARGTTGGIYIWGDQWREDEVPNTMCNADPKPSGQNPHDVSPFGVFDMMGGVPEWLGNPYEKYPNSPYAQDANTYPYSGRFKETDLLLAYRGDTMCSNKLKAGSFLHRLADRHATNDPNISLGIRCVRGPEPPPLAEAVISATIPVQPPPLTEVDLSKMVEITAGEFIMGSDTEANFPQETVYVDTFYIDRYETTNREFVAFLNILGQNAFACDKVNCGFVSGRFSSIEKEKGVFTIRTGEENYPAIVTWPGAEAYCRWRGKHLPTGIEWEKAARGTDGRFYPWGNGKAHSSNKEYARSNSPVGSYPDDVSPFGVWDIFGNAEEWVADTVPDNNNKRIIRSAKGRELFYYFTDDYDYGYGVRCAYRP